MDGGCLSGALWPVSFPVESIHERNDLIVLRFGMRVYGSCSGALGFAGDCEAGGPGEGGGIQVAGFAGMRGRPWRVRLVLRVWVDG